MEKDKGSDGLFRLIHSLDPNEKGYVKKFLQRHSTKENVPLKIISAIEKQEVYDELPLKKQFKNFAVVKVQTWDSIMDALCMYSKNQNITFELNFFINQVIILHGKGLIQEARKLVDSCIKKCNDNDVQHALIKLLALKSNLIREYKSQQADLENFNLYAEQIQQSIDKLKEIYLFIDEITRFHYLYHEYAQKLDFTPIENFQKSSLLFNTTPITKQALKIQDDACAIYYAFKVDYPSAVYHLKRALEYVEQKIEKSGHFDFGIIATYANLVAIYIELKDFNEAKITIEKFKKLKIKNKTYNALRDANVINFQLHILNTERDLSEINAFLALNKTNILSVADTYSKLEFRISFQVQYLVSLLVTENYQEAIRWIMQCSNNKYFRDNRIFYKISTFIEVVLHYTLKDPESAIKKAKNILNIPEMELSLGNFKQLFSALAIKDKKKRKDALLVAMQAVKDTEQERRVKSHILFGYFDFFEWALTQLEQVKV